MSLLFFFSPFPSGAPVQMPLFDIHPSVVKPSQTHLSTHRGEGDIWNRQRMRRRQRETLSGKQKSQEMIAPSGHFSSIHQLPGPTPKIEKEKNPLLFLSLLSPTGRPYRCATGKNVIALKSSCVYRPIYRVHCTVREGVPRNPLVRIVCS